MYLILERNQIHVLSNS